MLKIDTFDKLKLSHEKTFYFWTTPEGRKKRASLGGKASIVSPNNPWSYWASKEGRKKRASMGAQAHKGKRCMYIPGNKSFKRIKPEDIEKYLKLGYHFKKKIRKFPLKLQKLVVSKYYKPTYGFPTGVIVKCI